MRPKNKNYVCFSEARNFVHELKIKDYDAWREYRISGEKPISIPSDPYRVYRNEWISWGDWLGTNKVHGSNRKYFVNDMFFKQWSYDMAYVLGFWWADGFITSHQFSITQNKKDKYILEKILKAMESNYPIKFHYRNNVRFFIKSCEIVDDIKKIGGTERKRLRDSFPNDIPTKYIASFIRGYFDGDGSVIKEKKSSLSCVLCSCSKKFLQDMSRKISMLMPESKPHIRKIIIKSGTKVCDGVLKRDSVNYRLILYKKDSRHLYNIMYGKSDLYLDRKKKILDSVFA